MRALVVALACLAGPAAALDLPRGAERVLSETEPLASHRLATGAFARDALPSREAEGEVAREAFRVPLGEGTTLQLMAPLRDQLEAEGYRILLDCEGEGCGGFDFRAAVEVLPPPAMFVDLADFRYLSAEREGEALSLLVSRGGEAGFVQVIRVREGQGRALPTAPVAGPGAAPADLGGRIEAEGRVVLDGLAFAPGSAALAPGGDAALAALAAYLAASPARRVALVGHTDAQGSVEANIDLSRRRAQAVADRLVAEFGVARERLEAHGMGWLAPRATNLTAPGREANRRVEAVVLP